MRDGGSGLMPIEVYGLREMKQALDRLPDRLAKNILRKAVREAAKPVLAQARNNARTMMKVRSGSLVQGITSKGANRNKHNRARYAARQIIGVRHGQRKSRKGTFRGAGTKRILKSGKVKYTNDPYYYYFLEKGTEHIPAKNFLAKALTTARGQYISRFKTVVKQEILRGALGRR